MRCHLLRPIAGVPPDLDRIMPRLLCGRCQDGPGSRASALLALLQFSRFCVCDGSAACEVGSMYHHRGVALPHRAWCRCRCDACMRVMHACMTGMHGWRLDRPTIDAALTWWTSAPQPGGSAYRDHRTSCAQGCMHEPVPHPSALPVPNHACRALSAFLMRVFDAATRLGEGG